METRGRGREARATSDENCTPNPSHPQHSPQPPSTRSRTRRAAANHRPPVTRVTRASAASASQRASASTPLSRTAPSSIHRPRRTSRRLSLPTTTSLQPTPSRPPFTRKRARSSSRRQSSSATPSTTPAATAVAPPANSSTPPSSGKLLKKPRRSYHSRQSRTHHQSPLAGPSAPTSSRRAPADMDPSTPSDGRNERPTDLSDRRDDDGPSSLGSDRGGPTTLQGLLRRLGADLGDIFPGSVGTSHTRLRQLLSTIRSPENDAQQIEALSQLCEFLSVGTEESMVSFSIDLFVQPLVNLLETGTNIEIKIYAARALTHMMEALPSSSSSIAHNGAAGPLCQNLLSIEYIDLAEQSLSALQKLSVDYPQQIVRANGFQAVLSFIDFFSIGVQRVAAATACNLCRLPPSDAMDMISSVLPTMSRLLDSEDQRIRESAVLGFTRLAETFKSSSEKLETLCGEDCALIEKILGLIVPTSPPALAPQSYSSALRLLALLSRGSAILGLQILSTKSLILKLSLRLSSGSNPHSVDCLNLADSLLPEIPDNDDAQHSPWRSRRRRSSGSASAFAAIDTKRREDLEDNAESLQFFGETLFDTLMKFYISSADSNGRRLALSIMSKFIALAPKDVLTGVISVQKQEGGEDSSKSTAMQFCPFVAALLGENGSKNEALAGLHMAAAALKKLPTLRDSFVREGVVHEIIRLAAPDADEREDPEPPPSTSTTATALLSANPLQNSDSPAPADDATPGTTTPRDSAPRSVGSQRLSRGDLLPGLHRLPVRTGTLRGSIGESLDSMVSKAAKMILRSHLGAEEDGTIDESAIKNSILESLTSICERLESATTSDQEAHAKQALSELVKLLTTSSGLTIFEVSKSGIMEALAKYLTPQSPELSSSRMLSLVQALNKESERRPFASLVDLVLGVLSSEEKFAIQANESSSGTASASVSSGLRQLAQPFKLKLRKAPPTEGGANLRDYSHHVVLIEPLATMAGVQEFLWPKVRESDRGSSHIVSSEGRRRNMSAREGRADSDSEGPNPGDDDVQMTVAHGDDDGPDGGEDEDRFAVEGMFDMVEENNDEDDVVEDDDDDDQNSDPSDEEVSSVEEDVIEQGAVDSDEHDNDAADSFDVDQLGTSIPPFELDHDALGHAPSHVRSALNGDARARNIQAGSASRQSGDVAFNETTFRSYAAALAANLPRGRDRGSIHGGVGETNGPQGESSDRSRSAGNQMLSFSLNGKEIPHDCSILSAVIQSSPAWQGIGSRLWGEVHTLVYSKATPTQTAEESINTSDKRLSANRSLSGSETTGAVRRSQRLQENRERSQGSTDNLPTLPVTFEVTDEFLAKIATSHAVTPLPRSSHISDIASPISAIIDVLRQLHWINEHLNWRSLRKDGVANAVEGLQEDSSVQFVSHKLSAKLMRQLSDPLALCGGFVPSWCFSLARGSSFLIPFETRRILFQSTSMGVARALHHLQARTDISGVAGPSHRASRLHRESETRIGRIERQKVRVHRNRILESAIRVMNMYASHSTVLEVQYFDEVGTGLGPTLEFYTLASREIQRMDLGLWRSNATEAPKQKVASTVERSPSTDTMKPDSSSVRSTAQVKRRSRRNSQNTSPAPVREQEKIESEALSYVIPTGTGLFPSCLPIVANAAQKEAATKTTALFGFVGKLVGKAMIDGRLLDLRFSSTFSRLLLAYCRVMFEHTKSVDNPTEKNCCGKDSIVRETSMLAALDRIDRASVWDAYTAGSSAMKLSEDVDPLLASSLKSIVDMLEAGQEDSISSLCLTFVLPGDDDIELTKGGSDMEVDGTNAKEFVRRVMYHVLFGGVQQQAEALLRGLGEVLNVKSLLLFEPRELELLICGPSFEEWTIDFLVQATRCDHGYSHESASVLYFLRILSELDRGDQQRFVQFATGSPALPLGGLRNLHPRLTIVRRTPENGRSADECLPTVMTCTNYFKLPDYSSYEVAKKQTMYAVREGQGCFHLS